MAPHDIALHDIAPHDVANTAYPYTTKRSLQSLETIGIVTRKVHQRYLRRVVETGL